MKGQKFRSKTSGRLYLTQSYLVFVSNNFLSKDHCVWHWYDIFDISTNTFDAQYCEPGKILLIDASSKPSYFLGFENADQKEIDRICKVIRRTFFGVNENSVLHIAVEEKDEAKIKQVCDRELRLLNKYNRPNETPLIIACVRNNEKITKLLLEYYRNDHQGIININQTAQDGEHLLHVICRIHNISDEILHMILQFPGINVNCKNDGDTTPLHYFVQHNHSVDCQRTMKLFFEGGADPNAKTKQAETCLHKAIFNNKVRMMMVKSLLLQHARADARGGREGDTPLHYAIRMGRKDLVVLLLSNGGDVTVKNEHDKDSIELSLEVLQTAGMQGPEQRSAEDIAELIGNVKELKEMLDRALIPELLKDFVEENITDPESLCSVDTEEFLLKKSVKLGGRMKFAKEIAELKKRIQSVKEEEARQKAKREAERKRIQTENAIQGKQEHNLNTEKLRIELGGDGWEIEQDQLEFTELIGKGTSGSVFAGLFDKQPVAIKVLSTSNIEQELVEFKKEFKILLELNSEYMIKFYGAVVEKYLMMVMELCERGSLYDVLLKTPKEISWARAASFASDMAEGIVVLHAHDPPIIHRDMKSLNLLVTKDWRCKICDFGLSRMQVSDSLATMGRLCGTFHFAGPEVFQGGIATDKFDVYSMGIVLWELLSTVANGKYEQPYAEYAFTLDFQVIVQSSQGLRPSVPKGAQLDFVEMFHQCVMGDPEARPSALEVAQAIRGWMREIQTDKEGFESRLTTAKVDGRANAGLLPQAQPAQTEKKAFTGWKK